MTPTQQVAQRGETFVRLHRGREDLVVGGGVAPSQRSGRGAIELHLVDDEDGGKAVCLGDHEEAIELARARLGIGGGSDDHDLIDVGRHRLRAPRAATAPALSGTARQHRAPRPDAGDRAFGIEVHDVPGDDAVVVAVLELPAEGGVVDYLRRMDSFTTLPTMNTMLAGRSARRRMRYGYQCVPKGT